MSKHTPGPWMQTIDSIVSKDFVLITSLNPMLEPDEINANARLIVAAPEMLEALKSFLNGGTSAAGRARAAIDKAEGNE